MPENMPGKGLGHFFGAMRIDAFRPADDFKRNMDQWITRFKNAKPMHENQKVLIPGDPEREMETYRLKNGIPLVASVVADLEQLGKQFGVPLK
jgi:L-2-hydroxycarboxylate dehydrogenase (NAD+)